MSFFSTDNNAIFDLASLDQTKKNALIADEFGTQRVGAARGRNEGVNNQNGDQFILFQLTADGAILPPRVEPKLAGSGDNKDVNMVVDFDSFHIGNNENIEQDTKATLKLVVGQERKLDTLDKLFYCINGGLDLYNEFSGKKTDPKDFRKSTDAALGNKPISLPGGIGKISFEVVKHEEPAWWQRIFSFARSDRGRDLISLIGFGGITQTAVDTVSNMVQSIFDKEPEVLFKSDWITLAFSAAGKQALGPDGEVVCSLNPGNWLMARLDDYKTITANNPQYNTGFGILQPRGMDLNEALDPRANPFSGLTYAVLKARMNEVNLKQLVL